MKKIIALVVVALFAAVSYGDALTSNSVGGVYELTSALSDGKVGACSTAYAPFQGVYFQNKGTGAFSSSVGWDSLNGATDKCTLLVNYVPARGKEILIQYDTAAGSGRDSLRSVFAIYAKSSSGVRLGKYICSGDSLAPNDSIFGTGINSGWLPMGTKIFGDKYDVVIEAYTGNGGRIGLPVMRLAARIPVVYNRTKAPATVE
jgi:hypothetical protein